MTPERTRRRKRSWPLPRRCRWRSLVRRFGRSSSGRWTPCPRTQHSETREQSMGDLDGRVAVITGAARGIGLGCAECLSRDGASVVIADIDYARAEQSAENLSGPALAVEHDVRVGD